MQTEKTVDSCFIVPILPHKLGNVRDFWDDVSEKFRSDMEDQLKGVGIKRLLVFLQTLPEKGDFMAVFMQSADSLDRTLQAMFATDVEFSKYLTEQLLDCTGLDLSKGENVPKLELLSDWMDVCEFIEEKDMLKMAWCFAVPIKPGMTDELRKYVTDGFDWSKFGGIEKLLREHDVRRRLSYIQRTPRGDFIVAHVLASSPLDDLILDFASCSSGLCNELKKEALRFIDVNIYEQKNVPNVNLLFKWDEVHGFETAEQTIAYTE